MTVARTSLAWVWLCVGICVAGSGCVTQRPLPLTKLPWEQRRSELAQAQSWQLDGRVAVAVADQGWQASLTWRQQAKNSEVHLSGPLGVGAVVLQLTPEGLTINGGPRGDEALADLQDRLGFALPLAHLRYWVLGIADPALPSESAPNDQDRLLNLSQDGWSVAYDRYSAVDADVLPSKLVLSRDSVRVRMSVDHWTLRP